MVSFKGKLLVASPRLVGSFSNTVIFMTCHNREGATGFCINRKSEPCLCPECSGTIVDQFPTYLGGPVGVGECLCMIHGIERLAGKLKKNTIMPGVYWGTPRKLDKALQLPRDDWRFKIITGCSRWDAGQLEREIATGCWLVEDATPELVLDTDPDDIWHLLAPSIIPQFSDN